MLLWSVAALSAPDDGLSASDAAGSATDAVAVAASVPEATEEATEEPLEEGSTLPFDPALVGLPGLPVRLERSADFDLVLTLIDARLAALREASAQPSADTAGETAGADAADAAEGPQQSDTPRRPRI
jgi:hypothetical protein